MTEVKPLNPNLFTGPPDPLYHFGFEFSNRADYTQKFGDVKFICTGGSANRIANMAKHLFKELAPFLPSGLPEPQNLSKTDRYSIFKVGPVLCINHGIGMASLSIMLTETLKLLYYAECKDVVLFRCGTSGGLGVASGTVVITEKSFDGELKQEYKQIVLGKQITLESQLDIGLGQELLELSKTLNLSFPVVRGNTMSAQGFYEEQGRQNSFTRNISEADAKEFVERAHREFGIVNIEMEAVCIGAFCRLAGVRAAVICATLLDRLKSDIPGSHGDLDQRPTLLVTSYIKRKLQN